jgi:predicted aspartyl protease
MHIRPVAALALTLAALSAMPALRAQVPLIPADGDGSRIDIMTVDRDRYDRMTVPVTINGRGPYRFLVDTGAQATVVTPAVVDALGLAPSGQAVLVAMASRALVDTVALDGLEFAGRRFDNLTTPLLRGQNIGADGIIGLDSLQDLRVVIDFQANAITVRDSSAGERRGYEIVVRARRKLGQMIITDARIGGVRTAVIIDTGSWHSHANLPLQRKLRAKRGEALLSTDVHGAQLRSDVAVVRDLRIGRVGIANVTVGFTDSPAFAALGLDTAPALILGLGNLRPFDRVAIDFASRRVLFDVPADVSIDPFEGMFGPPRMGS